MSFFALRTARLPHSAPQRGSSAVTLTSRFRVKSLLTAATMIAMSACTSPEVAQSPPTQPRASASTDPSRPLLPQAQRVPTRIGTLAVRDTGLRGPSDEVIVLWPSILSDHRIYRTPIETWRTRYRLVVVDGPGHGDSGPAPGPFTMAQCGQALRDVLDALGIAQPVVVVGTSWGGLVAGEFALAEPQRTRAVVLLNTPVFTAPEGPSFSDRFVAWGARWIHGTGVYRDGVARAFFLPATRDRNDTLLRDFHQHLRDAQGASLALSVRSVLLEREPLAPRMPGIVAPTLVVAGRHDAMYPAESLRTAAATLPRGRFEVLDTAHLSVVDAPEATTALIDGFMASLPPVRR